MYREKSRLFPKLTCERTSQGKRKSTPSALPSCARLNPGYRRLLLPFDPFIQSLSLGNVRAVRYIRTKVCIDILAQSEKDAIAFCRSDLYIKTLA
nr:MAG TPA: hypothetical protein [Caudoviricetes sp.]